MTNSKPPLSAPDTELDEILLKHRSDAIAISQGKSNGLDIGTSATAAKAAILKNYRSLEEVERAIGEDDITDGAFADINEAAAYRNELRAELRRELRL